MQSQDQMFSYYINQSTCPRCGRIDNIMVGARGTKIGCFACVEKVELKRKHARDLMRAAPDGVSSEMIGWSMDDDSGSDPAP